MTRLLLYHTKFKPRSHPIGDLIPLPGTKRLRQNRTIGPDCIKIMEKTKVQKKSGLNNQNLVVDLPTKKRLRLRMRREMVT